MQAVENIDRKKTDIIKDAEQKFATENKFFELTQSRFLKIISKCNCSYDFSNENSDLKPKVFLYIYILK